jgi:hypothetical protein
LLVGDMTDQGRSGTGTLKAFKVIDTRLHSRFYRKLKSSSRRYRPLRTIGILSFHAAVS